MCKILVGVVLQPQFWKCVSMEQTAARVLSHLGNKDQPSKGFQILIRQIGEAKTKHEEDRIIKKESQLLKERVASRDVTKRQMREYLIRLIYCEMLGVECSWGYIHAVKFTQTGTTLDKRIGYLAASLFLHRDHELNVLLVATLQKDLKSSNMLEVSMALIFICKLVGADMIPPLLTLVQDKLLHPKELVRKKAVMAMHCFFLLSPDSVTHLEDDFRRSLSDKDPGVMEAALILFHDLILSDTAKYKDLTESFVMILQQVIERKLPDEFNYHGVPAPWIQMRLLRILALLGADDLKMSEKIYGTVESVLVSAECTSDVGQAISYECIRTVASVYPNNSVVAKTAKSLSRFVTSTNNNWRYLGITGLALLVQVNPKYAQEHQMVVIDCLDDPDDTLRRKTLDLLYKMTNPLNVVVITEKLIGYLRQTRDNYIRSDLVSKVTQLAERFAPDNMWFIQTMNAVFEIGGSLVRRDVAHNLMRLIAEGTEDETTDLELRQDAVSTYIELLDKPHLPDILIKIICWVVGEYSYVLEDADTEGILEQVTSLLTRRFEDKTTSSWVVSSVTKLVARLGSMPDSVQSQVAVYLASTDTDIQQRCNELLELSRDLAMMQTVLPLDSACEDLEVDSSLSFLDDFVTQSLAQGASRYKPQHLRPAPQHKPHVPRLKEIKFEEYPTPAPPSLIRPTPLPSSPSPITARRLSEDSPSQLSPALSRTQPPLITSTNAERQYSPSDVSSTGITVKMQRVWGSKGYAKEVPPVAIAIPPLTTITPTHEPQLPVGTAVSREEEGERGWEGEGERERSGSDGRVEREINVPPSRPLTAVNPVQAGIVQPSAEEIRKQQLASQLFGGGGGLSGPSRAPRHKRRGNLGKIDSTPKPKAGGQNFEKPAGTTDLLLDLQDVDFSQATPPINDSTHSQPPSSVEMNFDPLLPTSTSDGGLLDNMEIHHHKDPPAPQGNISTHPNQQTNNADILGLSFDDSVSMATDKQTTQTAQLEPTMQIMAPQVSSDISLLEPTPTSTVPKLSEPQGSLALNLLETPLTSLKVPEEYSPYTVVTGWENKDVCQDASLRLCATKLLKPDELVLVLYLTNQKQADLSGVTLTLKPSSNIQAKTGSGEVDLTFQTSLSSFATGTHVITLLPSSPAIRMSLQGEAAYNDAVATNKRLFFDAAISTSDFIRPLEVTTQEYGKKWAALSSEKLFKISASGIKTAAQFMDTVHSKLNLHPIQIIGQEGIAAGTFLPKMPCLVHGKVTSRNLDLRVRTASSLLTDSIVKLLEQVFKSH